MLRDLHAQSRPHGHRGRAFYKRDVDDTCLHAGAGGVGSAAIQLGRAAGAILILRDNGPATLIVTTTSSLLVGGDADVSYGVVHARQVWQPVMRVKHTTLGVLARESLH